LVIQIESLNVKLDNMRKQEALLQSLIVQKTSQLNSLSKQSSNIDFSYTQNFQQNSNPKNQGQFNCNSPDSLSLVSEHSFQNDETNSSYGNLRPYSATSSFRSSAEFYSESNAGLSNDSSSTNDPTFNFYANELTDNNIPSRLSDSSSANDSSSQPQQINSNYYSNYQQSNNTSNQESDFYNYPQQSNYNY